MLTSDQFKRLFPTNKDPDAWTAALNLFLPKYGIDNNPLRLAAFLAQCGHESQGFNRLKENLNYNAEALTRTWPRRFPAEIAAQYARQPEKIGNRAYADRMGNGPEASGDGWKHRGRGVIQLTGGDMYRAFAKATGKKYDDIAAYLETKEGAVESACWFWVKVKDLNHLADAGQTLDITKRINGGTNGLADRNARYAQALTIFQA